MRVALIPPVAMLRHTVLTDMQMMLAPQVTSERSYGEFYRVFHRSDPPWCCSHIILDNGACEGESLNASDLLSRAISLRVDEVVIPDMLRDRDASSKLASAFLSAQAEYYKYQGLLPKRPKNMLVLQGKNVAECIEMFGDFEDNPNIDIWGLPRHLVKNDPDARLELALRISVRSDKPMHALGAETAHPVEIYDLARQKIVRSLDTSLPYVYGLRGIDLAKHDQWQHLERPENYFSAAEQQNLCLKNVGTYLRWAYGH